MFSGTVIHGDHYGRQLGYRTANLNIAPLETGCVQGVYAAYAWHTNTKHEAALVIDMRRQKVEVHLLDVEKELYGDELRVEPIEWIDDLYDLKTEEELRHKIAENIRAVRDVFIKPNA